MTQIWSVDMTTPTRVLESMNMWLDAWQGLTLVHYSAQVEPFLTQKHTLHTPKAPYHPLNIPETTPNCTPCHAEGA
jgi:hypothetical protein